MYTYFLILNDYGVRPSTIWSLALIRSPFPNKTDTYDADAWVPTDILDEGGNIIGMKAFGNTNLAIGDEALYDDFRYLGWDKSPNSKVDVRLFYATTRGPEAWTNCRWAPDAENLPRFYTGSYVSEWHPVCYSTESLKMAQSGYLVSIVCVQWADLMICKTRNLSLSQQGMINNFGNFGLFFETALVAVLCYLPWLNVALGTRQIAFAHFTVPSFSFYVAIFFYDEMRKIWLRNGMVREDGRLKLKGWIV